MLEKTEPKTAPQFLTATWSNLALLSYIVPPSALQDLVPPGCELDLRDGQTFVSLVAFDFNDTRVFGVSWPTFRNFPEVNLRFYVRHAGQRGVCFVSEFVPRKWVALVAKVFYNEPYVGTPMSSLVEESADSITVRHDLRIGGARQTLTVSGKKPPMRPEAESLEEFLKEHSWGYGATRRKGLITYRVEHPTWEIYPIQSCQLQWDWRWVYGERWEFLQDRRPDHVMLAIGSAVRVLRRSENAK